MKISILPRHAFGVCATVILLTACSGRGLQPALPGNSTQPPSDFRTQTAYAPTMKANGTNTMTMFVTDAGGESAIGAVYAFDYPSGTVLGALPSPPEGWNEVQGSCVDKSGNAYFANTNMSTIDEYSHGGKFIQALSDPGQFPASCAYDPSTGNLAVANILSTSFGPGSVSIYSNGVLQNTYFPSNMYNVYYLAYADRSGTLYLDGQTRHATFKYDKLSKGSSTFTVIKLDRSIAVPQQVLWDGKYIAINAETSNEGLITRPKVQPSSARLSLPTSAPPPSSKAFGSSASTL